MDIYKSPELKKALILDAVVTIAAALVCLFLNTIAAGVVLLLGAVLILLKHRLLVFRVRKVEQITMDIDKVLHGNEQIDFSEYEEGELSILKSEIEKMFIRLRDQSAELQKDKQYLADSIANISHQIKTPLTSINLIVRLLQREELDSTRKAELFAQLDKLLKQIEWLIASLLKMSKIDAATAVFRKEKVSVRELIQTAIEPILIPMDLKNQTFTLNCEKEISFLGDDIWTREAILNIIKNCMEHTGEGGEITVTATENAIYTEIILSDNGSGIAKEDLPNLFKRFYKGQNSSEQSFGIGLALARMIVTAQNGTIKAENNFESSGAKFTIRFYKSTI